MVLQGPDQRFARFCFGMSGNPALPVLLFQFPEIFCTDDLNANFAGIRLRFVDPNHASRRGIPCIQFRYGQLLTGFPIERAQNASAFHADIDRSSGLPIGRSPRTREEYRLFLILAGISLDSLVELQRRARKVQKQISLRSIQEIGPGYQESRLADYFGDKPDQRGTLAATFVGVAQARLILAQFLEGALVKMVPAKQAALEQNVASKMAPCPLAQLVYGHRSVSAELRLGNAGSCIPG